jgi:L-cysteine desulfidase
MASALGALGGDAARRLEVLDTVDDSAVSAAQEMVGAGRVKVNLLRDQVGLLIKTVVHGNGHVAESVITGLHDNIVSLTLDGKAISDSSLLPIAETGDGKSRLADLEDWLKGLSLDQLIELLDDLDDDDLTFLESGIEVNLRLADYGLKHGCGLGVGRTLERLVRQGLMKRDMITAARIMASSAADARMSGVKLPAMSSAGSGNHGLTAILPIVAVEPFITVDHRTVMEAIGLSHIITAYVKAFTGRLSAICGCSVAAGAGATAGVTYLMGGSKHHIAGAIKNLTEDLAGVICDGAKGGCALKLATAAGTAVQAALFSLQGVNVSFTDGIIGRSPEDTMKNIGTLTTQGMIETDRTILNIMLEKQFSDV